MSASTKALGGKKLVWALSLIYFSSYVTRINLAAVISEVVTETGFARTELAAALTCLFATYGLGQIVNGMIGDRVKPQNLILTGLIAASAINFLFPLLGSSPLLMAILWGMNGFAQAMMWPPIVKILVATMDDQMYSYAVVRVSWGSSIGTVAVYMLSPFVISLFGWKGVFILSALIGTAVTVLWSIIKNGIEMPAEKRESRTPAAARIPKKALFPMAFIALGIIFQGMLRDGVTSWMPTYLAEIFKLGNKTSIFCTVSLAIFGMLSYSVATALYKRFFNNEVTCGGVIFGISVASAVLLFLFFDSGAVLAILLMAILTACMHGINLMLITHVPKRFKKYGNISTISGAVNACTYIGSAIFTYAVAFLSEKIGWRNTVGVWAIIALLGGICCLIAAKPWRKFYSE
ncbi:MAG: MFS transporter [Clostridia bacterium]|nr:MFS transporter [Clostridia bacterium]